ncbi:MAG: hypothetical protein H6Q31_1083 [Bacteroidetes bacterium]|nr:hypothetical protein [Bacteroidota bacterium]
MTLPPDITGRVVCATRAIAIREQGPPVERTVADLWRTALGLDIPLITVAPTSHPAGSSSSSDPAGQAILRIHGGEEGDGDPVCSFRMTADGAGELRSSHPRTLYFFACMLLRRLAGLTAQECKAGIVWKPTFPWLRNLSDHLVGSLRVARHFSTEEYCKQIAQQGFTHVTINGLGVPRPFESGPPGDTYFWFYDYSPDLDQFVDSDLIRGYYPADYLSANLAALTRRAELARRFGLVPGLHINSPRSMPEEFWNRNGYLRGARVDHPRETFRPRYTLAMAHPIVQNHYRSLLHAILREVPDLGFIHIWTNDSGSGFEFVSSLYAGRNGGPYLLREWKDHDEIARAAARNVLTYYGLLRDEGQRVNPAFRVVCDLAPFFVERPYIIPGLGNGLDAGAFGSFEEHGTAGEAQALAATGAMVHGKIDANSVIINGLPYPGLVYDRVRSAAQAGTRAMLCGSTPWSLAPYDCNGEVVRALQADLNVSLQEILLDAATRWAGAGYAPRLVEAWMLSDEAIRAFPGDIPMSTFAFPWFRLWVRPFVPDIDAIAGKDRAYYERFLLATFNNPARIDLNADMLWRYQTVAGAAERKIRIDNSVLPPLENALRILAEVQRTLPAGHQAAPVFDDLHDRLLATRAFLRTMRNTMAWTEAVHGYTETATPGERERCRHLCKAMVENELDNARDLLALWKRSQRDLFPVSVCGETLHIYGDNFGDLLEQKIALMERHTNDEPRVDNDYMWRKQTE